MSATPRNTKKKRSMNRLTCTALFMLFVSPSITTMVPAAAKSPYPTSTTEGQTPDSQAPYVQFDGKNGLELDLDIPAGTSQFDYTVMFWFRSQKSLSELQVDESILDKSAFLFELPGGASCYVTRTIIDGPFFECTGVGNSKIKLTDFPDVQAWMHLTYSANFVPDTPGQSNAYVSVDGIIAQSDYRPIKEGQKAYYGCGAAQGDGKSYKPGFPGDYRQFYFTSGFVAPDKIDLLKHQEKTLEYKTLGHYTFVEDFLSQSRLADQFRDQRARPIVKIPKFLEEPDIANPFCDSISQNQVVLPVFEKSPEGLFENLDFAKFDYKQNDFSYTVSMWLKNFGNHTYSADPVIGRDNHHMLDIYESFAIWLDSPISFRVYVFAKKNINEVFTDKVYLPLNEWINIQVSIDSSKGITVMTFNQNGAQIQLVEKVIFLAEQYPKAQFSIFQSFTGIPLSVQVWQKQIKLPIDITKETKSGIIINYNFSEKNYSKTGWKALNGPFLPAKEAKDFKFIYEKVPATDLNFKSPTLYGQLNANSTQWNGVSCPNPVLSQSYFNGVGAGLNATVTAEKTDSYTVEFWFRPDVTKAADLKATNAKCSKTDILCDQKGQTYFLTMESNQQNAMSIYVEDGKLKCSPFGRKTGTDAKFELVYEGVGNPLEIDKWQHISCAFSNQKFVKGTYLAINLDANSPPDQDQEFPRSFMQTQTFALSIVDAKNSENSNVTQSKTWNLFLGNDANFSKAFYGSLKDLRVWKTVRSDGQLYSYRFRQVPRSADLKANFKFMDGSPYVLNAAASPPRTVEYHTESTIKLTWLVGQNLTILYAELPRQMKLIKADGQNLICASDTFFDSARKVCTRHPYTEDVSLVYTMVNNEKMQLQSLAQSSLFLPGLNYQPKTSQRWIIDDQPQAVVQNQKAEASIEGIVAKNSFSSGIAQKVKIIVTDAENHSFSQQKEQTVIPIKCKRIVDSTSGETSTQITRMIGTPELAEDLCFNFEVRTTCSSFSGSLKPNVKIESQPPLSEEVRKNFSVAQNGDKFKVCIPKATLIYEKMPMNVPIVMIFSLLWDLAGQEVYMNVMYKVTLVAEIRSELTYRQTVIDVDSSDSFLLSATNSQFVANKAGKSQGLTYRWICQENFQVYCDLWEGSPILQIPNSDFLTYGKLNTFYNFTVAVSSIEASQAPLNNALVFKKGDKFIWSNQSRPKFKIIPQSGDFIHVTSNEKITIQPINFRFSDPGYTYQFILMPESKYNPTLVSQSPGNSVLVIQANALKFETEYTLLVKVFSSTLMNTAPGEDFFVFVTKKEPKVGQLQISPETGKMFETNFTVTMSGYQQLPEKPLRFMLFGIVQGYPQKRFRISATYTDLDIKSGINVQSSSQRILRLPYIEALEVQIIDENGEIGILRKSVSVSKNATQTWSNTVEKLNVTLAGDQVNVWRYYMSIAYEANTFAEIGLASKEDAIKSNSLIAKQAQATISNISESSTVEKDLELIRLVVKSLQTISEFSELISEETLSSLMLPTIQDLLKRQAALSKNSIDPIFSKDFVSLIGNLMDKTSAKAGSLTSKRRLLDQTQSNIMGLLVEMQNTYLDQTLCQSAAPDGSKKQIFSENLEVILYKVPSSSGIKEIQFVNNDATVQMDLPVDQLLLQTKATQPSFLWICIKASFIKSNPVMPVPNQAFLGGSYSTQISTLDNTGYKLLQSDKGLSGLNQTPYRAFIDFNFDNLSFFSDGQTLCMHNDRKAGSTWSYSGCKTSYVKRDLVSKIKCSCTTLRDQYFGVITDTTIKPGQVCTSEDDCLEQKTQGGRTPLYTQRYTQKKESPSTFILLAIVLPLIMIGVCMPWVLFKLDQRDHQKLEVNTFNTDFLTLEKFKKARGKSCMEEVIFNEQEIQKWYIDYTQLGCFQAFATFNRTVHPLFSLFMNYDYRMARNLRFSFVLVQICLVTLFTWFSFSKSVIDDAYALGTISSSRVVWVSIVISLLSLPPPKFLLRCFETKLYVLKRAEDVIIPDNEEYSKEQTQKTRNENLTQNEIDFELTNESAPESFAEATLIDPAVNYKTCFYVCVYLLWMGTVFVSIWVIGFVGERFELEVTENYKYYIEMTEDQTLQAILMWYLAVFVWGWLLIFEIRILLISLIAPRLASHIFAEEQRERNHFDISRLNCCTRLFIPSYSLTTCLDILYLIDIKKNPDKYMPLSITTPGHFRKSSEVELSLIGDQKKKSPAHVREAQVKKDNEVGKNEKAQFKTNEVVSKNQAKIVGAESPDKKKYASLDR